jgi:hypothetical protein
MSSENLRHVSQDELNFGQSTSDRVGIDSSTADRKDTHDMRPGLSESGIVRNVAEVVCKRVLRKVIRDLQELDNGLQSGDDSGLTNAWEEICVQTQTDYGVMWDAFDVTVGQLIEGEVSQLPEYEREAVWLQTPEGEEWDCGDEERRAEYPVADDEIVEYLKDKYIYPAASDWSNKRIRKYLEQSC